jgi:adenine-specific DNA-methyltransferase
MSTSVPIRYMGTKRQLAQHVRRLAELASPHGSLTDLFSGMGSVAAEHAGRRHVVTNDAMGFTAVLARARFVGKNRKLTSAEVIARLRPLVREQRKYLISKFSHELATESKVIEGTTADLIAHMSAAHHAGCDERFRNRAINARSWTGAPAFKMACLYYAGGYFSVRQTIDIDAIRYAIESAWGVRKYADWLLAAWLSACSRVINAPGHTAQYLKPNSKATAARIKGFWRRSIWDEFKSALADLEQVGPESWRAGNRVVISDALALIRGQRLAGTGVVYADPPYTKDQYSRFYHVFEALHRYDYPTISGEGRAVSANDRFSTGFCRITQVEASFIDLFEGVATLGVPLVLSYPSDGLLTAAGSSVETIAKGRMTITRHERIAHSHSTMGASSGAKSKPAMENIYVCHPA